VSHGVDEHRHHRLHADHGGFHSAVRLARRPLWRKAGVHGVDRRFTLASLFCGLSNGLVEFVIARAIQGAGSALMTPVGRIIVLKNARKSELVQAIALITWPALTAPVIGPLLGSVITTYASWHWNFLINLPIGALGMVLVWRFVPEQREEDAGRLDMRGFRAQRCRV
jgi:MFS family permease